MPYCKRLQPHGKIVQPHDATDYISHLIHSGQRRKSRTKCAPLCRRDLSEMDHLGFITLFAATQVGGPCNCMIEKHQPSVQIL